MKITDHVIAVRSAGDIASGVVLRLFRAGFTHIVMLETAKPLTVRRKAAFSEAICLKEVCVESIVAKHVEQKGGKLMQRIHDCWAKKELPVLVDPKGETLSELKADVLIDALIAKENKLGTSRHDAPLVIALGPGFTAGIDAHAVIETQRGHNLGRVFYHGNAAPNTGIPGEIGGKTTERVLRAPCHGKFTTDKDIGDHVAAGDVVGMVETTPVQASIAGVIRGLLRSNTPASKGLKLGDIDPRKNPTFCTTVSDKALAIGGGVLEAILARFTGSPSTNPSEQGDH